MEYKVKGIYKFGHFQTIYQYIWRKKIVLNFQREIMDTYDGDIIALDWHKVNSKKVVIIIPGLESGSVENYILGTVKVFEASHIDSVIINLRGCMVESRSFRAYHSGFIDDLYQLVEKLESHYEEIYLVGYSLGGNVLLNYIGRLAENISKKIKKVFVISAPFHLESCSKEMERKSMRIYTKRFIHSFYKKNMKKIALKPSYIEYQDIVNMRKMKTFAELDRAFVVKLFGFKDEIDYWHQTSACNFFEDICVDTTIINANDDPFLSHYVKKYQIVNPFIEYIVTKHGGHCGFIIKTTENIYFHEKVMYNKINPSKSL
ncbi:MAG: alpha/beta fold hydrolase [Fusobacteria bacterium]|nr:alpha/beta fold hydrolase [Fusobacteriota bacterium]